MTWWKDLGPGSAWVADTLYIKHPDGSMDFVGEEDAAFPGVPYVWIVSESSEHFTSGSLAGGYGGFSDPSTEPTWDITTELSDGGNLFWVVASPWDGFGFFYSTGDVVQPTTPNGHAYQCLGSGTSGDTEPTWPTDGSNVDDGGTGSETGSLVDDPSGNDAGNGGSAAGLSSTYIYQVWENPALDRDAAPIGVLTEASDRMHRMVRNNCGEGKFTISRHSDQAAWLVQERLVVVYRESIETAPVFCFILETANEVAVSPDEDGGDLITWSGRGSLALLERAVLWYRSVLPNGDDLGALPQSDRDGMWHWVHKSAAAILVRQLEEAVGRGDWYGSGVQDCAIPNVYWTFARHTDSLGDPYPQEGPYKLAVGDNLFSDVLPKLMQIGLMIRAVPVINGDGHLRIRLDSWANDPGVATGITFAKGVNIVESGEKVLEVRTGPSVVLVQGDLDPGDPPRTYAIQIPDDPTFHAQIGRREAFLPYHATSDDAMLERAGQILIANGKKAHNGPTTLQVIERSTPSEIALVDYIEWDYVTVDISGVWDEYVDNLSEIILVENDIGVFDVGLQFAASDPVGVVGIMVDNCACGEEPGE